MSERAVPDEVWLVPSDAMPGTWYAGWEDGEFKPAHEFDAEGYTRKSIAVAQIETLRALLREAAEALRVLADQADETGDLPDGALLAYPAEACLVAGDLRRARTVLAKLEVLND